MEDWQNLKLKQNPDKKSVTFFVGCTLDCEPFRFVAFFFPEGFEGGNGPPWSKKSKQTFQVQHLQA